MPRNPFHMPEWAQCIPKLCVRFNQFLPGDSLNWIVSICLFPFLSHTSCGSAAKIDINRRSFQIHFLKRIQVDGQVKQYRKCRCNAIYSTSHWNGAIETRRNSFIFSISDSSEFRRLFQILSENRIHCGMHCNVAYGYFAHRSRKVRRQHNMTNIILYDAMFHRIVYRDVNQNSMNSWVLFVFCVPLFNSTP